MKSKGVGSAYICIRYFYKVSNCRMATELLMDDINRRIMDEICQKTIDRLRDENLFETYLKCRSVKKKIKSFKEILEKNQIDNQKIQSIVKDYVLELIPPGTKGTIRGNKFNEIIKENIENFFINSERFEIQFEKQCPYIKTSEKPDWYILDKSNNKILIGMNQLDLWNGGHQLNRGEKYLMSNINFPNVKLVCVICNKIQFTNTDNKAYKLFNVGFKNNTLCYLNNLRNIIYDYFD